MTTTFIETPRFPERISLASNGGPGFANDVVGTDGGSEYRTIHWDQPLHSYVISQPPTSDEEKSTELKAFFLYVHGRAIGFRFKDWTDYKVSAAQGKFQSITSTTFQMMKRYVVGSIYFERKITKPVSTVTIVGGVTPVVDYTTGIVTVASGTPTSWSGEFDVPVRFDTDKMDSEVVDKHPTGELIIGWNQINIVEIRE